MLASHEKSQLQQGRDISQLSSKIKFERRVQSMTNGILNPRVKKLIKDDLLTYAKIFGGFWAAILVIKLAILHIGAVRGYGANLEVVNVGSIIIMFIAGITTGVELSIYVRQGVARNEYFKAAIIGAIIVSVLLTPFTAIANHLINLMTGSESLTYSLSSNNVLSTAIHMLLFNVFFLGGYLISVVYQRLGWFLGIIITLLVLLTNGIVSWRFEVMSLFPIQEFIVVGERDGLVEVVTPVILGPILIIISVILASTIYALVKNIPATIK